jgi:small subunit ribosomal protein S8e
MAQAQARGNRKASGGRYHPFRSKRKFELARFPALTKIAEKKLRWRRTIGGNKKVLSLSAKEINVANNKGKVQKAEIVTVLENPANPNLVGRNILTKGAIVETKLGKVRVTSRPGQEASVNGVLVE